jgi:choline dehydrogenase-like flavoprotein
VHYFVGGATKLYGAALYRLRAEDFGELRHHDGISPRWPISYDEIEPYYTQAEQLYQVHGARGEDPTEPHASAPYPFPPVSHEPRIQQLSDDLAKAGVHPFHAPCGIMLNEANMPYSACVRCDNCDGFPCVVHAKSDAEVIAVRPALEHDNVTLFRNARAVRLETNATGTAVTGVVVERETRRHTPARSSPDGRQVAAPMFRGEKPGETALAPHWTLEKIARHAIDFWLSTEDLPRPENRVTLTRDGGLTQIAYKPSNVEPKQRLYQQLKSMLAHLGMEHEHLLGRHLYLKTDIPVAGCAHQAGTCRFGNDPSDSVLNRDCRAHELDNLYVVDTGFFPSIGAVNPALTAIANALRVGDHLLERMGTRRSG